MTGFQPRTYRKKMEAGRFRSIVVRHHETDLWVGVDPETFTPLIGERVLEHARELRKETDEFISQRKDFLESLVPVPVPSTSSQIIKTMAVSAEKAGVGPMAAVAGAFAEDVGRRISGEFRVKEIVVENGGDIYLQSDHALKISVFAGDSPLSDKICLEIPPEITPCRICTSSATVCHSLSFGKADAVCIVCRSASDADAFATSFCNKVKTEDDIGQVLEEIKSHPEILSAVIVIGGKAGIGGKIPVKFL